MLWVPFAQHLTAVTPIDSATDSLTAYILSYGVLGVVAVAAAFLASRGWRLVSPAAEAAIRAAAREDLLEERDRVLAEKHAAEAQRDEALSIARDQIAPLLVQFVGTTSALVPLLQEIIRDPPTRRRRGGDP